MTSGYAVREPERRRLTDFRRERADHIRYGAELPDPVDTDRTAAVGVVVGQKRPPALNPPESNDPPKEDVR